MRHPRRDEHGQEVTIARPSDPSPPATWTDPKAVAVFVPDGPVPTILNGIPLRSPHPPADRDGWSRLVKPAGPARMPPPFPRTSKKPAAGAVVVEPDGRIWLVEPTNHWGGYDRTFPKGGRERGYSFEATAAKEVFEETGLLVEIGAYLVDCARPGSVTRFFLGRRVGGTPKAMGWETQAVCLVPLTQLRAVAPHPNHACVVEAVLARDHWELGC
jgi:ADP-ribose pyrophosphatase YjhB (NUDIX family)